ncbi:MAG TPA: hypothetical protein PKL83_00360, partial [bacterium]|nr:hypothetical protein [bacterium]
MTEDMPAWIEHLLGSITDNGVPPEVIRDAKEIAHRYFTRSLAVIDAAFPGRVHAIEQVEIDKYYRSRVEDAIRKDPNAIIIINDRYLAIGIENEYPNNVFRFSITRLKSKRLGNDTREGLSNTIPRPGDLPFDEQFNAIEQTLNACGRSLKSPDANIYFADDVTTTGSTEQTFLDMARRWGAQVDEYQSIYNYVIHHDAFDPAHHRDNAGGDVIRGIPPVATAEQREYLMIGGRCISVGDCTALLEATQEPFGWGLDTRADGFVHRHKLDAEMHRLFIEYLQELAGLLANHHLRRSDGSIINQITLADVR